MIAMPIVVEHAHIKGAGAARDLLAYIAHPDDAEGGVMNIKSVQEIGVIFCEFRTAGVSIAD